MPALRIGFGAFAAFHGSRAVHRYVVELMRELVELPGDEEYRFFSYGFRGAVPARLPFHAPPRQAHCWTSVPGRVLAGLWDSAAWPPAELFTGPIEVFHATDFDLPPTRARRVFTVHGVSYLARPDTLPADLVERFSRYLRRAVERCELLIAVSETTGRQLLEHHPEAEGRVRVIPLGVGAEFQPEAAPDEPSLLERIGVRRPYILYVGAVSRLKNFPHLVTAFRRVRERVDGGLSLVVAGPPPAEAEPDIARLLEDSVATGEVKYLGFRAGEELPALYRGARAFAFPSFSEGWASPPLEAMACGVPVVASNASSLPETVGDAALLVAPENPEELAAALEQAVASEATRSELISRGLRRAGEFRWGRIAARTLEVYRELGATP